MTELFYELGKNLTDKIYHHRYDRYYPLFVEKLKNKTFNLLEIGISKGKSLELWEKYFPYAQIYGIDINKNYSSKRTKVYKFDQSNEKDLENALSLIPNCSLIIDDGSHVPEHQLKTFIKFFDNLLNYGGIYIIEDIECNYWKTNSTVYNYRLSGFSIFDYFQSLIHQINNEFSGIKNIHKISSITFAHNCIIVIKQTSEEVELSKRIYRYKNKLITKGDNDES